MKTLTLCALSTTLLLGVVDFAVAQEDIAVAREDYAVARGFRPPFPERVDEYQNDKPRLDTKSYTYNFPTGTPPKRTHYPTSASPAEPKASPIDQKWYKGKDEPYHPKPDDYYPPGTGGPFIKDNTYPVIEFDNFFPPPSPPFPGTTEPGSPPQVEYPVEESPPLIDSGIAIIPPKGFPFDGDGQLPSEGYPFDNDGFFFDTAEINDYFPPGFPLETVRPTPTSTSEAPPKGTETPATTSKVYVYVPGIHTKTTLKTTTRPAPSTSTTSSDEYPVYQGRYP